MRRIRRQRQVHLSPVELAVRRCAKVILHVARTLDLIGHERATLELIENRAVRLAHHLAQDVEPTAMGHAEHDFAHAECRAASEDFFQRRNGRLGAVETESLCADELLVEVSLIALHLDELVEDGALASAQADALSVALDRSCNQAFCSGSEMCMNS